MNSKRQHFIAYCIVLTVLCLAIALIWKFQIKYYNSVEWKDCYVIDVMTDDENYMYITDSEFNRYKTFMPTNDEQASLLLKEFKSGNISSDTPYYIMLDGNWFDIKQE